MEKAAFDALKRNDVIYNKETKEIVIMGDHDPKVQDEAGSRNVRGYDGRTKNVIKNEDADKWEFLDDNAPDGIKLQIMLMRLTMLEEFVFSRLK